MVLELVFSCMDIETRFWASYQGVKICVITTRCIGLIDIRHYSKSIAINF